ncbi:hypothetical protein OEZ85_011194 [Tetradesmus obliquus]|uniref:cellulase n=1 Tax=Tetradesmus obliquus TaxID=3088 RepID=A0ABY8TTF6_TETOB|nr:hypothetical protein OEZ85_011194 [Tetradesmus obliquus]
MATAQAADDYSRLLGLSMQFYQAQMSGSLPNWNSISWRKSAHLNDGADAQLDLVGGFYDAGDYLKCPLPLGWSLSNLALAAVEYKPALVAAGQWELLLNITKWGADWLIKGHVMASDTPSGNAFVGQVGDIADLNFFGRPEHAKNARPVHLINFVSGGADVAAEYAAAFASVAVLYRSVGATKYADLLFKRAQQAYGFSKAYPKNWVSSSALFQAYVSYYDNGYLGHTAWAAAWLCKYSSAACPEAQRALTAALSSNLASNLGYDWDNVLPGATALMLSMGLETSAAKQYLDGSILSKWKNTNNKCPTIPYYSVCYTPKGLAYYSDWGTLRSTAAMSFIATLAAKYSAADSRASNLCWAAKQVNLMVGGAGRSYVVGYGPSPPKSPHHRQSACSAVYKEPCRADSRGTCCAGESGVGQGGCCNEPNFFNSHTALVQLSGALVGGPDNADNFPDSRPDYQRSEVALDYTAAFTAAVAGVAAFNAQGALATCGSSGGTPPPAPPPSPSPAPNPSKPPATPSPSPPPANSPPVATPSPAPQPPSSSCSTRLPAWSACGGKGFDCKLPAGKCTDAAWEGHCCASGFTCQRSNEWYWQCRTGPPSSNRVEQPAPAPATACAAVLTEWAGCGGRGTTCPKSLQSAGQCADAQWKGYCCAAGLSCKRQSQWWWSCQKPRTAASARSTTLITV